MIFVFTGIDGAGKSTQINLLQENLENKGVSTTTASIATANFAVSSWVRDKVKNKFLNWEDDAFINKSSGKQSNSATMLSLPLGISFLARGVWNCWIKSLLRGNSEVIIFDRYIYDTLVRVAWKYDFEISSCSFLTKLVPQPDYVFFLDASAKVAQRRESNGRTDLQQHRNKRELMLNIKKLIPDEKLTHLNSEEFTIESVQGKISEVVSEIL